MAQSRQAVSTAAAVAVCASMLFSAARCDDPLDFSPVAPPEECLDEEVARPDLVNPVLVEQGSYHTCAVDDGGLKCWGSPCFGQLDLPAGLDVSTPAQVVSWADKTCALTAGSVSCWGGQPTSLISDAPGSQNGLTITAFDHHNSHGCAITDNDKVTCWGYYKPFLNEIVPTTTGNTDVSVGLLHGCVLHDGGVSCWGSNDKGQLDVPGLSNPVEIESSHYATCARDDSGIKCWGKAAFIDYLPASYGTVSAFDIAEAQLCYIEDATAKCVGLQLDGAEDMLTVPAELTNETAVSTGPYGACGLGDSVVCWGGYNGPIYE